MKNAHRMLWNFAGVRFSPNHCYGMSNAPDIGHSPKADADREAADVRNVPIVLQKSFCRRCHKFREPLAWFSCRYLEDLIASG
jgi:hypothetical protein